MFLVQFVYLEALANQPPLQMDIFPSFISNTDFYDGFPKFLRIIAIQMFNIGLHSRPVVSFWVLYEFYQSAYVTLDTLILVHFFCSQFHFASFLSQAHIIP